MTKLLTVHVRVNDAATGRPTPVRIRFTDAAGTYYAPFGRLTKIPTGRGEDVGGNVLWEGKEYAYIDGTCEVQLPPGLLHVEIHKGPEYDAVDTDVPLGAGQIALRFTIARRFDLRAEGWYSGDTRAHFLTPHAALLEGQAEDLAFVNLLAHEERQSEQESFPNLLAFSGQAAALERDGTAVVVNTLNQHPVLGTLALLNCHRIVFPLSSGGSSGDYWSLNDWCRQCHRKGGLAIWCPSEHEGKLGDGGAAPSMLAADIDAVELRLPYLGNWYDYLNINVRLPVVGTSGKVSNTEVLGKYRTYARLRPAEAPSFRNWIEAIRSGRTFATYGPLLDFNVEGEDAGATINFASGERRRVHVQLGLRGSERNESLQIIGNGETVASAVAGLADEPLEAEVDLPEGGWISGSCRSADSPALLAHTSPVFIQMDGKLPPARADCVMGVAEELEHLSAWVEGEARCLTERQREQLQENIASAQLALRQRAQAQ